MKSMPKTLPEGLLEYLVRLREGKEPHAMLVDSRGYARVYVDTGDIAVKETHFDPDGKLVGDV